MTLEEMKQTDIKTISKSELKDIREITYIETDNKEETTNHLRKQLGNLYAHKCGNIAIYNDYTEGTSLSEIVNVYVSEHMT